MRAVLKTNDPVALNYAEVLLRDAGIAAVVFDSAMSIQDGSLGILPRRLMVADEDEAQARRILSEGLQGMEQDRNGETDARGDEDL